MKANWGLASLMSVIMTHSRGKCDVHLAHRGDAYAALSLIVVRVLPSPSGRASGYVIVVNQLTPGNLSQ